MKRINYIIVFILLMIPSIVFGKDVNIYLFENYAHCGLCRAEEKFLEEYLKDHENVHLYKYNISIKENKQKFYDVQEITNYKVKGIPHTIIGDHVIHGYARGTTEEKIKNRVNYCLEHDCPNKVGVYLGVEKANNVENDPPSIDENPSDDCEECEQETSDGIVENSQETPITHNWYTVTYELDGGHFIDDSTTRIQAVRGDETIDEFKTNPIKSGYKFLYWKDSSGKKVDVATKKPIADIVLTAAYEKYTEEKYYCKSDYEYDPAKQLCYTTLETYDDRDPYNFTTYAYKANERVCSNYYGDTTKPGKILRISGTVSTVTGKNNATTGVYSGWSSDSWLEKNTCNFGSACTEEGTESSWYKYDKGCVITYKAILYKEINPSIANKEDNASDKDYYISDDGGKVSKTDKEVDNNAKTGDGLIWTALIFVVGTISYSIYYFKNAKKDESNSF